MHFLASLITVILAVNVHVNARPQGASDDPAAQDEGAANVDAATVESLTPEYGVEAGVNDDGSGNCETPIAPAKIPCTCPPPRDEFLTALTEAVQSGETFGLPAPFPTDDDPDSEKTRLTTMLSVLQNIDGGVGQGCPAIATTYKQRIDEIDGA